MNRTTSDLHYVEAEIARVAARLVVIDPLMAYLGADINSFRDQDVRRALAPLGRLAERTGVAVVVVRHLNKASGGQALYRGGGSIGIVGAARSALLVAADPSQESRRVLAGVKSNLGALPASLAYTLLDSPSFGVATVSWEGTSNLSAEELLGQGQAANGSAISDATEFLGEVLADGPVESVRVFELAERAGIRRPTLNRAKKTMAVKASKGSMQSGWVWSLPAKVLIPTEDDHSQRMTTFGNGDHLRADCGLAELEEGVL